ncbi:WecB/TagA/CpsF family glycosyltransferase [Paenibacillus sp. IB182496]|uniref:WecB/TagA/CpsF family glycosyltransferase n=1 Tax=Paenibacillus sabuli TaxID=2772509 RepID=A0A927BU02_9BACL|nr:WecB/TagA/CpsF family glycosyltransferase [Paenibacillus sabuli]MBD2845856.1 WecB/TagA/CpsF family glycosyltransferase [Paenibacillus sabuli]
MEETVARLIEVVNRREPAQIVTGNPIMVMAALEDERYYRAMASADLIVPDGAGVVWAANYVGEPVTERVAGFDLLHRLMTVGESKRWRVFLLGSSQEVVDEAAARLGRQFPLVTLVGARNGYFDASEDAQVIAEVRAAQPDLLFVARAASNQEPWIAEHKAALGVPLVMGVGGSFDIIAGKLKRAPLLMRKLKLEWFYRLLKQPSRLPRMLVLPKFALKVIRERKMVLNPHGSSK